MTFWNRGLFGLLLSVSWLSAAQAKDLNLQVATLNHPHVRALQDGRVKTQGCDVHLSTHSAAELNADLVGAKHFDVLEVDLVRYLQKHTNGELQDYVLIPVFLEREFQLRNIYIRTDRGIVTPADLRGKTIGLSGYGSVTPTWIRGILQSSWSVKPGDMTWLDTETSTRATPSLSDWIERGQVDAIFSRVPPPASKDKTGHIKRLFENFRDAEFETFKTTRIFPIGSALAIRKKLVEDNPWVCESLFIAFSEAKKKAMADLTLPLPWDGAHLDETENLMGKNFWSYGVKNNPKTLSALFRYVEEQGLVKQPLKIEDVFESSTVMLLEN